jgi:CNT family concentrative nucleoside transporter
MMNFLFKNHRQALSSFATISLLQVPADECAKVGEILGLRVVLNEFVGYVTLTKLNAEKAISDRAFTIASYALCGFANISSIAIQIGGIQRREY